MGMAFSLIAVVPVWSHFGMLIPTDSMVMQDDSRTVSLTLSFSHPFEMAGLELVKPKSFGVVTGGKMQDLLSSLTKTQVMGHTAWMAAYRLKRPGIYVFYMEPEPYWEASEDAFIIHYTKKYTAPTKYMTTQTIRADGYGVFTYAAPVSGWWGFAAINAADYKLPHNGEDKDVELGAVIWVYFHEMK